MITYQITDLQPEEEPLYFCCLEDWSDEIKEAGNHKEKWYRKYQPKGVRVKIARDGNGTIGGMIQYLPVEHTFADGHDVYVILCIWVHGHKQGRGDFRRKGMGTALLKAAEEDVRQLGAKGIAAWGISLPFWMRASWFRKQGYTTIDKDGMMRLLFKKFSEDAEKPSLVKRKKKPENIPGKVNISLFKSGWCPAQNITYERTKRAIAGLEDKIILNDYNTSDREVLTEWGISDALFIDKKEIRTGPPPSFQKIRTKIEKKVKKLQ